MQVRLFKKLYMFDVIQLLFYVLSKEELTMYVDNDLSCVQKHTSTSVL
jgi:hypothetical protein